MLNNELDNYCEKVVESKAKLSQLKSKKEDEARKAQFSINTSIENFLRKSSERVWDVYSHLDTPIKDASDEIENIKKLRSQTLLLLEMEK